MATMTTKNKYLLDVFVTIVSIVSLRSEIRDTNRPSCSLI